MEKEKTAVQWLFEKVWITSGEERRQMIIAYQCANHYQDNYINH